jgi:hypothetical protein
VASIKCVGNYLPGGQIWSFEPLAFSHSSARDRTLWCFFLDLLPPQSAGDSSLVYRAAVRRGREGGREGRKEGRKEKEEGREGGRKIEKE